MDCVLIDVVVVLTGAETIFLLFDEEEGGCLWRVQGVNFASFQILIKKVFDCLLFFWRVCVYFANFGFKGLIKIYFMVVRMGRGDMVHCFLQEH